jgi:fibronectin type 3 domain-containing protein
MCNHQDFAGVGIGIPDNLLYWRVMKLKQMGANAYRCSHNPPTTALLNACDQLGMLVMDENRHLGDASGAYSSATAQTPYSDLSPLNAMILRDRNHPSIVLWSMCNEESLSGTQAGADIFNAMRNRVRQFDTSRPVSCAMNSGWFNVGISLVEDLEGFNYSSGSYDSFHEEFTTQPMYGSETTSAQSDRGEYTNDSVAYVSAFTTTPESSWQPVAEAPFMAGGFVWTGFDYKGEPSPYGWPCISSKYGNLDSCGLPKDDYYFYQAWWGSQPLVHVFPHWNWTTNQTITVWCYANTASVELFLNGISQGAQTVPAYSHVAWSVPYAPGTLLAKGYDGNGNTVATNQVVTTGAPAAIALATDRTTITSDGEDVTVVYASIVDAQGLVAPTASNQVTFAVQTPAYVAGVGNGNPASHEPDRASQRHAFNGWCMALVGATNYAGPITLTATSPGLTAATLNLQAYATNNPPAQPKNLAAAAGNNQASLTWTIAFNAASYNIKRATVSDGPYITIANYTAVAFTDTGLSNGVTYYYVVSAVNGYGESTNSSEVSVTPVPPSLPAAPAGLSAQADDGQVLLSWNVVTGATSYNLKRASASAGPYTSLANVTTNGYTDTAVTNGGVYYYVVSALNAAGESTNPPPVSAAPFSMTFLVGTSLGTTGSYNNAGNIREMALDGNLSTFFDASNSSAWVGIDLGTNIARSVCKIRYAPRSGFEYRMDDAIFQGANQPDFSDAAALYTITNTPSDGYTAQFPMITNTFRYLRYFPGASSWGNIAELEFYSPGPHNYKLTGPVLGTSGSWDNSGNTITNAVDGNILTFFDGPTGNGDWVGMDLGNAVPIANIRFFPRIGYASRMNGGIFQGANDSAFATATNLWTLTNSPPDSTFTAQVISNSTPYRFVRYLSTNGGFGNVAEVQFFGPIATTNVTATNGPSAPGGLSASPGNAEVALTWTASTGATSYNVKRALVSGGPYTTMASPAAPLYLDTGLAGGTYYYVVSALNSGGESANSSETNATVSCPVTGAPTGLAATAQNGQLLLAWTPVVTGSNSITYNVLRATGTNGPFTTLATGLAATNFTDSTTGTNAAYYYAVQAVNTCGQGLASATVGITPLSQAWLGAIASGRQGILLSWPSWLGDYAVCTTTNLGAPGSWQILTNVPQASNSTLYLALPATNTSPQFFRLISQ